MPFFSIIIPSYNRANLLPETLASVIEQKFTDWECIVVDDGSTDDTAKVIFSLCTYDPRIRYVYQQNKERSVARNHGIDLASGQYICFLDSDDWYLNTHLSYLHSEIIKRSRPEALFFVNAIQDNFGKQVPVISKPYDKTPDYFLDNSIIPARVCIHRNILEKHRFNPSILIVEDSVLWSLIHFHFPVFHLPLQTAVYRWHDDNSVNIKNNCFLPRLKGLQQLFLSKDALGKFSGSCKRKHLSNCYYGMAKHYAYKRHFFKMFLFVFYSILLFPNSPQSKAKLFMLYAYYRKPDLSYL
jgi:glycosyltransferase involved in cell wall biosynthesis